MSDEKPFWQSLADQGHSADILRHFDNLGEGEVRRQLSGYGENYSAHARLWLKLLNEQREQQRQREREEDLASQARMATANERGADAAQTSAAAAGRAAGAAEASALEARRYRQIALAALVVSALALALSAYAIFKPAHQEASPRQPSPTEARK